MQAFAARAQREAPPKPGLLINIQVSSIGEQKQIHKACMCSVVDMGICNHHEKWCCRRQTSQISPNAVEFFSGEPTAEDLRTTSLIRVSRLARSSMALAKSDPRSSTAGLIGAGRYTLIVRAVLDTKSAAFLRSLGLSCGMKSGRKEHKGCSLCLPAERFKLEPPVNCLQELCESIDCCPGGQAPRRLRGLTDLRQQLVGQCMLLAAVQMLVGIR